MNKQHLYRVCVITMPNEDTENGNNIILNRFIKMVSTFTEKGFLITGGNVVINEKNIRIIKYDGNWNGKTYLWKRISRHLLANIRISISLVRLYAHYDIVIFFTGSQLYILPAMVARILKKKLLLMHQGSYTKLYKSARTRWLGLGFFIWVNVSFFEKIVHWLSDRIIVESHDVIQFSGFSNNPKVVVGDYYSIDTNLSRIKTNINDRKSIIGYMGQFHPIKGIMQFVSAIPLILAENKEAEFIMIGDGELFAEIQKMISINNLKNNIRLTGWVQPENVPDLLNEVKLLVLPSFSEGLPGSLRDAMACGTIVLATAVGGIPDLVKDGETGFILENSSPECITQNVIKVLGYTNLELIARNARYLIENEYSLEAAVNRFKDILINLK